MSWSPPAPISAPSMPDLLRDHPVFQVHAADYKNPEQLPPGAVLVVGAGASGAQIAEELLRAGRRVFLSVGRHRRLPRRYRGRDLIWWLAEMRLDQITPEQRGPARLGPVISGAYGGHTIDFRRFAADGMTLVGADRGGARRRARDRARPRRKPRRRRPRLHHLPRYGGRLCEAARACDLPEDPDGPRDLARSRLRHRHRCTRLDLAAEGISAVIWATGYGVDFGWIDLPVFDAKRRADAPQRHHRRAGPVFPRPAMAVEDELLVPVRRRRRRRRARRPYSGRGGMPPAPSRRNPKKSRDM